MAQPQLLKNYFVNKSKNSENISLSIYNSTTQNSKKAPEPTLKENLIEYFANYCSATSIHGIQYVGERGRFIIEKIVWVVIIIAVWSICIILIVQSYYQWQNSPVIVTFATTETSISEIPFPAITICPEVKFNPAFFNYTDVLIRKLRGANLTDFEEEYFDTASLICDKEDIPNYFEIANKNEAVSNKIINNIFQLANSTVGGMSWKTMWQGKPIENFYHSLSLTENGICMSFNMISTISIFKMPGFYLEDPENQSPKIKHWSLEDGYAKEAGNDAYPRRTFTSGLKGGVKFHIFVKNSYLDYLCGSGLQGFKVIFHNPSDLPNLDKHIRLPLDSYLQVGIKPNVMKVSEQLKNYSPQVRKCYFTQQKSLMYFNNYTQNNCMLECLANYTLERCKCLPFYLPKNRSITTCGFGKSICVDECKVNITMNSKTNFALDNCDCLPLCGSLDYDVEISPSSWNWRKFYVPIDKEKQLKSFLNSDVEKDHMSSLSIYYKQSQFIVSERNELHGYVTFFSDTGGLLGLFIGFSITSGLEILYFLTLRIGCNIKKYGKSFWSGNTELMKAKEIVA